VIGGVIMDCFIKEFEEKFNTRLTERDKMIFNYAYNCSKQKLNENNQVITKVINQVVGYFRDFNFTDDARSLAKKLNLEIV
jgi:hypothetical protein